MYISLKNNFWFICLLRPGLYNIVFIDIFKLAFILYLIFCR